LRYSGRIFFLIIAAMSGPELTPQGETTQVGPQQAQLVPAAPAAKETPGMGKLRTLMAGSEQADPNEVAKVVRDARPAERDEMLRNLQQSYGNGYVQKVIVATQQLPPSAGEPKAIGSASDSAVAGNALPKTGAKNPADALSSNMTTDEANTLRAETKNGYDYWPKEALPNGQHPINEAETPKYVGTPIPVQPAPGKVAATADTSTSADGKRLTETATTTNGTGSMQTTVDGQKLVGTDPSSLTPEQQTAALTKYRAAVSAALGQQITSAEPRHQTTNTEAGLEAKAYQVALKEQKSQVATATSVQLDKIIADNKLLVARPEELRASTVTTTTQGTSAAGIFDGSPLTANNQRTTNVTVAGPGTTTTAHDETKEVSLKGVNRTTTDSTTVDDTGTGTLNSTTKKSGLTGGIIDPLKYGTSTTTVTADNATATSRVTNVSGGVQSGNGFAGGTAAASISKGDKAPQDGGAPDSSTFRPSASVAGQAGVIQNDKGLGVTAGVTDGRVDLGTKATSYGGYGAIDGSLQVLVAPTPDGGVTLTFTATVHGKLGAFAAKRGSAEPVTTGNETSLGGGVAAVGNRTVTRTHKYAKAEADQVLGDLDKLASGTDPQGKKTFGTKAAETAYMRVFNSKLSDLVGADPKPGPGESVSVQNEAGGTAEIKSGTSTGDGANVRTGIGGSASAEHLWLNGREEAPNAKGTTLRLMFGERNSGTVGVNGNVGAAGGSLGGAHMDQHTTTYVFSIPKDKQNLLDEARAISSEKAAQDFAAVHKELVGGTVGGSIASNGHTIGASVGPVAIQGGSTSTTDENLGKGVQTTVDEQGRKSEKKTLSGTEDGSKADNANVSVLGVKLANGSTNAGSHATVDADGQASLALSQTAAESNAIDAVPKNLKANDKTDLATAAATGGGPMGLVKKLAERVGESSTVGAHLNDAQFNQLVGAATDFKRWKSAILVQYTDEWYQLRGELLNPKPPQAWIDQDEASQDHLAAKTLMQMKSLASFCSKAGTYGQDALARIRGEYSAHAIGITTSWPPSLQDQKLVFDDLTKNVEHLKQSLAPYAEAGDLTGGNAYLDKLTADLGTLRTNIQNAPDHQDPTLGIRAANGIGDLQQTVATFKGRFANALTAFNAKKPAKDIDAELDAKAVKSQQMIATSDDASAKAWQAKQAAKNADAKNADWDKAQHAADDAQVEADKVRAAENQQRVTEAADNANRQIPDFEQRCLGAKGRTWAATDKAKHDPTLKNAMAIGNLLKEWQQEWKQLEQFYKDAGKFVRMDLAAGLPTNMLADLQSAAGISDNVKGYVAELKQTWGV